tara:strand:+ start:221 stop:928 length:708 start_codon:yes stop_codon:yes gene_type:complete
MKYFISAPFGNYLKFKNAISVRGTFTVHPRPGRLKQILKTLRYVKTDAGWGWRNQLGLRNPGLFAGMFKTSYNEVLSVAALEESDWEKILMSIGRERNIELNISCPNLDSCNNTMNWPYFDKFPTHMIGEFTIVKIPPIADNNMVDKLVDIGYTCIHASNTVPSAKGGLSGKIITPYTMKLINYIKNKHQHVSVIAGGGVTSKQDAKNYVNAGADHISLGSVCFTPWKVKGIINE